MKSHIKSSLFFSIKLSYISSGLLMLFVLADFAALPSLLFNDSLEEDNINFIPFKALSRNVGDERIHAAIQNSREHVTTCLFSGRTSVLPQCRRQRAERVATTSRRRRREAFKAGSGKRRRLMAPEPGRTQAPGDCRHAFPCLDCEQAERGIRESLRRLSV